MAKQSIIGKPYIANDNSYSINLTTKSTTVRLAGTARGHPKLAIIVSEPYTAFIGIVQKTCTFVNVRYEKDIIRVLFKEANITDDLEERKEQNRFNHRVL